MEGVAANANGLLGDGEPALLLQLVWQIRIEIIDNILLSCEMLLLVELFFQNFFFTIFFPYLT